MIADAARAWKRIRAFRADHNPVERASVSENSAMSMTQITPDRIIAAHQLIRPHVRRTPTFEAAASDFGLGPNNLVFKLELLQHSGSFKVRGAFTNLLTHAIPVAGVVAASGGNHGAALAFAAMKLGKPARIFVPTVASPEKMERIRSYGADLVVGGERYADALAASEAWAAESGALRIHAYDQVETLLGQGTVGLELEEQAPHLDTLLVAVGGGGLIGGMAAWYSGGIKIIGVEPEAAPTLTLALEAGRPVDSPAGGIAADSLAPKRVGELMFPIAQTRVHNVLLVSDQAIQQAQEALWKVLRIVAEPGGAAAFAALLARRYQPKPGERVGVLVCGGNTTAVDFSRGVTAQERDCAVPIPSQAVARQNFGGSMSIYARLEALKISLPAVEPPVAAFVPVVRAGQLLFVSGHIAKKEGKPWVGKLGENLLTAQGKEAARGVAIELLATLHAALGDLNKITRIVKLLVLVNSAPAFTEQHLVANGASELLVEVFGEKGPHARSAFGVAQIPLGACVEIELVAEVR
jgi:threonine dehydratase